MEPRNIIVVGASAGGLEALKTLVAGLPPNLEALLFVVWHRSPGDSVKSCGNSFSPRPR
ncbi:MAG TPA: chemotaxis protein CheB [Blastocatellia bacterium]|nr:chemotaxis protein CheB [Blastocatellia bacterium]